MKLLPKIAIERPVFAWMLMSALIIFGAISFLRLGVSQLPDVDFPIINISIGWEGAAPQVVESEIIDPVEDVMMTVEGIKSIESRARLGSASLTLEFDLDRPLDAALQDVQSKLSQVTRLLPKEVDPPVVSKTNPEDQPIMWIAFTSEKTQPDTLRTMMAFVRDQVKHQFTTVKGVGEVMLGGYIDPALRIWVDRERLNKNQLSVTDLMGTIRNEHAELPSGRIEASAQEFNVRSLGEVVDPQEISRLVVQTRGGQPNFKRLVVGDVARVEDGLADVRRISRSQETRAIGLGIKKQRGTNAVAVAHLIHTKVAEINKTLPQGMQLNVVFDGTRFIEESIGELNFTLILSALLTAVVCLLFLGSLSATFNVVLAIPTSVIGTFTILLFSSFTLNTFTLLGLSLAIGIVVDDAIMVLENIVRHREMGKSRYQAALDGSQEITFAAMSATIAIVAIFIPVAFMQGVIGKFFYQFGITMTAAVLLSLVEALTLTPMRCAQFVETKADLGWISTKFDAAFNKLEKLYIQLLAWCLARPKKIILASLLFFAASLFVVKFIKKEFLPAQDQGRFMVRVQTKMGSSLEATNQKMLIIEKIVREHPTVERYFSSVGGFGGGEVNTGVLFVTLKPPSVRKVDQFAVMADFRKLLAKVDGAKVTLQDLSMRGFTASRGFPLEFSVRGSNWETLAAASQKLMAAIEATGLVTDIDSDYQLGQSEVQVVPNRERAVAAGVSIQAIGETINALIGGVLVGKFTRDGRRYDIRIRLDADQRMHARDIEKLYVRNNRGELIRLGQVVDIKEQPALQVITRRDRERSVSVFSNLAPHASQAAVIARVQELAKQHLPEGYRVVMSGSSETFKESFQSLVFALLLGLVVSYMVLASQFNSFIDPITVLVALPFSLSGAFFALWMTNQSINIYSLIGLILLMGIVKKNSILLVDFTNQMRATGESVLHSLQHACPVRLRPISMTSLATIVGAIPPALAIGPGAESRIPMAVTVIGGVALSTVLTLLVVPCVYLVFSRGSKIDRITASVSDRSSK